MILHAYTCIYSLRFDTQLKNSILFKQCTVNQFIHKCIMSMNLPVVSPLPVHKSAIDINNLHEYQINGSFHQLLKSPNPYFFVLAFLCGSSPSAPTSSSIVRFLE